MAVPPLEKTPTDIMFDVFDLLTVTDLCNFSLVCRWARKQAFNSFAARGYKNLKVYSCSNSVCGLVDILSHNKELAAFVKTFTVRQCQFCIYQECGWYSGQPCEQDAAWTISGVISAFSNLNKLALGGMTSKHLARHLHREHARDPEVPSRTAGSAEGPILTAAGTTLPNLATVSLNACAFTSAELKAIVCLPGASTTHFEFDRVTCTDGNWLDVLSFTRDIVRDGSTLRIVEPKAGVDYFRLMPEKSAKFFKALRGEHGIEVVTVQEDVASMKGKQAIELGVEVITQYFTGRLWR
ncbi:hypothetical protein LTR56_004783 [Elasticomyces elasticus]|nr:hypothetical protein LTR56_004783 [Elasticomyces elasticus]KAK3665639.1 hypothetical protein LTR22_003579 [Elasticomyces elasticus]KAK4930323.1 hypothetical protein LTR49_003064 [Elasticomyces elasticus]KAK5768950.1 hypothetical protein LTS12_001010 [Elasticomyces elasticus]